MHKAVLRTFSAGLGDLPKLGIRRILQGTQISARNQLEGKVVEVTLGDIMAHVVVRIGKSQIESVITRRSAKELKLKKADKVMVVINSTEVMLDKS